MNLPAKTADHELPVQCENCNAALHGDYCHQCGQSIHNPVRHAGHAIEEVFESFWHLDGRAFRTFRDLLVPGRTTLEYLAGHRQRYLPPLRVFVIMSLLAFFVGKLTIHPAQDMVLVEGGDVSAITQSNSVEEVERSRDGLLAKLEQKRARDSKGLPGVSATVIAEQVRIQGEAANRIAELTGAAKPAVTEKNPLVSSATPGPAPRADLKSKGPLFSSDNEAWNVEAKKVNVGWLPGFANDWINRKLVHGKENLERIGPRPDLLFQLFMSSLPSALFVLVPVFALMLKIAYLFKRRLYMEHLVIALYSHVFLLMALTAVFVLMAVSGWVGPHAGWLAVCLNVAVGLLLTWMPIYLLLMQKRVYGQGWPMTLVKYSAIGMVYVNLLAWAVGFMFIAKLVNA